MSALSRAVRVLVWGLVASWIVAMLRRVLLPRLARAQKASSERPVAVKTVPLHRDPWCGTYVSPEVSVRWQQAGQLEHFCSTECLERYAKSQRRAATA
jgi:hypothetical protein